MKTASPSFVSTFAAIGIAFFHFFAAQTVKADTTFVAAPNGSQETPPNSSTAVGAGSVVLNAQETQITVTLNFSGLTSSQTAAHIHKAPRGATGEVVIGLPNGNFSQSFPVSAEQVADLKSGLWYFNVHSTTFADGEIRGQIEPLCTPPPLGSTGGANYCSKAVFTPRGSNGKIVFTSRRTGNAEIFTMNADGSNQTNISNNTAEDFQPAFSPDGSKIVFTSDRNGNDDIYVMNADGSNQIRLTTADFLEQAPSWSPDGTKIVFSSGRADGDIFLMNPDGTNQTLLTTTPDYAPKFSPDGSRIVFHSYRHDGTYTEIYAMNSDGTNQIRLTNNSNVVDEFAAFSPEGTKISFTSSRTGSAEIFVMDLDGSNPVQLTNNLALEYSSAWSPDGTKIAFESNRGGSYEIYTMNADGTNQNRLTDAAGADFYPSWQSVPGNVAISPANRVNLTFASVTTAGNTVATPLPDNKLPTLPAGFSYPANAPKFDIRTSALYSGSITVSFNVETVASAAICGRMRILHFENNAWNMLNNAPPSFDAEKQVCAVSQTVNSLSPSVVVLAPPTAASVTIGGRVTTAIGRGLSNARVSITNSSGETRTVITGAFGYYRFTDVLVGESYVLSVFSKRFAAEPLLQVITVTEENENINFTAGK